MISMKTNVGRESDLVAKASNGVSIAAISACPPDEQQAPPAAKPDDGLDIPDTFRRPPPTETEKEKLAKAARDLVDRPVKMTRVKGPKAGAKPTGLGMAPGEMMKGGAAAAAKEDDIMAKKTTKTAAGKKPAPKPAAGSLAAREARKVASQKAAEAGPKKRGIGDVAIEAILGGADNADALDAVMRAFPGCKSNLGCMSWYRNKLRKEKKLKADGTPSAKGEKVAAAAKPAAVKRSSRKKA